ncbi:coatomer subunit beta'-like isoform X4 [Eriocheir sinensis]|uniref:coatomer subunit beta'-like isoform X4 n=1 Tax=Eriocheir sinensis TaxID=95602 RepID=UPI0021C72C29|nr:coatomer subunit beta'-like isoform X4 [Eriocheir sinensis]
MIISHPPQPLRLDVKRKLTARSDRVKSVDLHPTEPWMLASLYNGNVHVWNTESQQLVKSFEVCDLPVRAARFVARKNWVVTGSDDMQVRVYNYNTLERVHQFEAHSDYVRCIAVHPTQPFILTCSDDMTIKLWNWDKKWSCQQVFEGHSHYVMQIVINPKDNNTFASASLDRIVKVWQLGSPQPNFTLEGHLRGVNCVDYYHGGDKPYLISGADDSLVKIWDYQNKTCVQTLEGHSQNVSSVAFHPDLPIILTGSEDCTVRVWHANTYRLENTLNYGLDRVWCISALKGSNNVCIGYDEGSVMVKVGREEPAMSMDVSGKIVWAKHSEIQQANLKAMGEAEYQDGERLPLAVKDLGACDIYPQTIAHNPNGRFVVVCGDGEYIIYTAMALRNKAFGPALEFVWALDSSEYAIRESNFSVKLFKNFKEKKAFKPDFGCEGIYGGYLLGCRSSTTGLAFYDWESQELVRRIEIQPRQVFWSENGDYVCIATDNNYFILKYSPEAVANAREKKEGVTEDGIEDAFDLVGEVQEVVKTGKWVGDCFIYTNSVNRLNYYVGGEIVTIAHLDRTLYLLGYIPKENRLYLGDKELNVVSYELLVSVLEYQTAVMRRDFTTADRVLPTIPPAHRTRVAHFLEKQGFKKQALAVSTDPEHKFDLALSLGELEVCHQLAAEAGSEHKWRLVADLAQQRGDLQMAQTCLLRAHDYPGLLLQATATGNASFIREVGKEAEGQGRNNVAFLSHFLTGNLKECLELLIKTNRVPEAAFFARTYMPSEISRVVGLWKEVSGEKIAQTLADPAQYDNLFPGIKDALKTQQYLERETKPIPAASTSSVPGNHERDAQEEMRAAEAAGTFVYQPPEGEDQEFVDAPQQLETQGASSALKEESLFSVTMSEPVSAPPPSAPLSAGLPGDLMMPTLAMPSAPDTVCDEPLKKGGEDLEWGDEIGIREDDDDDEDMLGCKASRVFATKKVEDAALEAMGEEGVLGQEVNDPEISSETAKTDYTKEEAQIIKGMSKMSCAAQPEFSLLTEDEEAITLAASRAAKESLSTEDGKDCTNMELKEDEEFLLPLKKDEDVLLPVKEDEENLLLVKEDPENVQPVDEDAGIPVQGVRVKISLPVEDEDDILLPRMVDEALKPQDEGKEEQRQAPEAAAVSNIPTSSPESPLEWDIDGAEGWEPEEEVEEMIGGAAARPTIDQAQLERELELDIEKVRIEDNIDPNDLNLDEEELLAD